MGKQIRIDRVDDGAILSDSRYFVKGSTFTISDAEYSRLPVGYIGIYATVLDANAAEPPGATTSNPVILAAASPDAMFVGTVTRDGNDAPTSASVVWPDGTTGTYTGTASSSFPGAIDSYTITYGSKTYTQPAVTRNANGAITARPAITVS